jgi:hypothetical protein
LPDGTLSAPLFTSNDLSSSSSSAAAAAAQAAKRQKDQKRGGVSQKQRVDEYKLSSFANLMLAGGALVLPGLCTLAFIGLGASSMLFHRNVRRIGVLPITRVLGVRALTHPRLSQVESLFLLSPPRFDVHSHEYLFCFLLGSCCVLLLHLVVLMS